MIQQKSPTSQQKKHKTQNNFRLSVKELKVKIEVYVNGHKEWRSVALNYLGRLGNRYLQIRPSQETIGQDLVTRQTINYYMKELVELGIIRKISRGFKQTCLYILNDWFFDPENRERYSDTFSFMKECCVHHLMSIFKEGYNPNEPNLWENMTLTLNKEPLFVVALGILACDYEIHSKNKHGPPRTLTSPTLA